MPETYTIGAPPPKYFIGSPPQEPAQTPPTQPNPGAVPLALDQNPQSNIQAGPPTPTQVEGKPPESTGTRSFHDWFIQAMTAPGTFFGSLLQPHKEPSQLEKSESHMTGQPPVGNLPMIDPSVGMEPGFFKGLAQSAGGIITPNQLPILAFTPESKALSGFFAAMTAPQLAAKYPQYYKAVIEGDDIKANTLLGEMTTIGTMGTLAAYHASGGGDKLAGLSKDERSYLIDTLKQHYDSTIREEIKGGEPQFSEVPPGPAESEGLPLGQQPSPLDKGAASTNAQEDRVQTLRDDTGTSRGEGATSPDAIERAEQERAGRQAGERELKAEPSDEMERRLRGIPITDDNISQLQAILPEFNKVIGGGEEAGAHLLEEGQPGAYPTRGEDEPPPPVISRAIDDDLAAGGINVVHRGKDIGLVSRLLGSFNETARKLTEEGHPLGPALKGMSNLMSEITKRIAANQTDIRKLFINSSQKIVSREEWSNQVVPLMDRQVPDRPPNTPDNIWNSYQNARSQDESLRVKIIEAKRRELQINGFKPEQAQEWYPDTWGRQGEHYPHLYPGTWTITRLAEVDEHGNETYEPIDHPEISWRATSEIEAKKAAQAYLESHPGEQLRVRQDTVSLPGSGITDRARLRDLSDKIKEATTRIVKGGDNPDEVLRQLYDQSGAAAYGPRNPSKRQFGPALQRETNLGGYSRDIDDFSDYLLAGERYVQLAPARQLLMQARNKIAQLAGMPQVQKIGDFPPFAKYFQASQYGNILARVDSAIEGLEGHPGAWDAGMRYIASGMGLDPDTFNKMARPIQQVVALMKLGFQPARVLSHGLQTLWAVYPVLGEVNTLKGIAHAYDSKYDYLIRDLAVTHSGNMSDIQGLHEYAGAYFGRGSNLIDWSKGTAHIIRDLGLMPFTAGIDFARRVAAVGGFLEGIDRGMLPEAAKSYAREVMDRTTGIYNASDNPTVLRQLPAPMSQFKGFMLKTLQFMTNLRGPEIARFAAVISLMGVVGFPAIRALSNLVEQGTGYNPENDLKRKFPVASRGAFGALGVDQPAAVGFADWFASRPGIPLGGLAGPAGSDILNFAKAGLERAKGPSREAERDLTTAIRQLSPEARRIWDEGLRSARGGNLVDPQTNSIIIKGLTPRERLEAAVGLTPLRIAEERESHEYIRNQIEQAKDKRGYFVDKLAENQLELIRPNLSPAQRADLLKETINLQKLAIEYNQGHNLVPAVRMRIKEMMIERLERDVRKAPKAERPEAYKEYQRYHVENP